MGKRQNQPSERNRAILPPWARSVLAAVVFVTVLWSITAVSPKVAPGSPETASAQAYVVCPNGQFAANYQACSYNPQQTICPGGVSVAPGQPCPGGPNTGQLYYCPGSTTPIPYGAPCSGQNGQTFVCPGTNVTVPVGTLCPGANTPTFTCPGTNITLPVGTPCPAANAPAFICPGTNITVPVGTPCTGTCSGVYAVATPGCQSATYPATPPPPPPSPATLVPAQTTYMTTASYPAGWNIISGPDGSALPGFNGTLYTLQAGNGTYQAVTPGTPLKAGLGYWAYFPVQFSAALATSAPTNVTLQIPAQQYVMIGNPGNTIATVAGADVVLIWNTSSGGYTQASQLQPGQGGWAGSIRGAQITITNAPS